MLYRQPLRHCDVGDRRPGLFLVLRAGEDATDANIDVFNMATGRMVCGDISLAVPKRILLPDATLGPTEQVSQDDLESESPLCFDRPVWRAAAVPTLETKMKESATPAEESLPQPPNRREFIKGAAGAGALAGIALPHVHFQGNDTIRIAVVGCGGRGAGAVQNALRVPDASGPIELVAMADVSQSDRKSACRERV